MKHDFFRRVASLPSPAIRNDAISAEGIAAADDGDKSAEWGMLGKRLLLP
jgi:hypothetical protein